MNSLTQMKKIPRIKRDLTLEAAIFIFIVQQQSLLENKSLKRDGEIES